MNLDFIILQTNVFILITVVGWGMAMSAPNQIVPVRFEMKGSYNYMKGSGTPATYFHVIGDFVDFNPTPPSNLETLQVRIKNNYMKY